MKKFEQHQKDAISAKMYDLSRTVFVSYNDGDSWEAKGGFCYYPDDSMDIFSFEPNALYVTVSEGNKEAAIACLINGETVEATYIEDVITISKKNIFEKQEHWLAFSEGLVEVKKEPLIMWVAATADSCSKPHNSARELASKLSINHHGEIKDGQVVSGFTFNMIKVEL